MSRSGDLFTRYGSDKNTHHSYGPLYDTLFPEPERVRAVLEVGIACGGGILAFREIFPNAVVVGFDKEPCHHARVGSTDNHIYPITPRPERLEIHQGDMRNRADLLRAVNGRQFDLIVEDATHVIDDNLRTLFWLWPFLAREGIYIIEEFDNVLAYQEEVGLFGGIILLTPPPIANEGLLVIRKP